MKRKSQFIGETVASYIGMGLFIILLAVLLAAGSMTLFPAKP